MVDAVGVDAVGVDAVGNPVGFFLTGGQAHDLIGADHLLPTMNAYILIADKAFNADERVIVRLTDAGKKRSSPPRPIAKSPESMTDISTKHAT